MRDIQDVITSLRKLHGETSIVMGNEIPEIRLFPTGIPMLDYHLGGGLMMGRMNFIAGKPASGKSSKAMKAAANLQNAGFQIVWVDLEKAFDNVRCRVFGLNPNEVMVLRSNRKNELLAENLKNQIMDLLRGFNKLNDNRVAVIIDSLAANVTEAQFEEDANKIYGGDAKINNQSIRNWNVVLDENQIMIFINEFRQNLKAVMHQNPDYMPGGEAQNYFASSILHTRPGDLIKDGEKVIGEVFKWTVKKSRSSAPKEIGSVRFLYETGFDIPESLIDTGIDMGVIKQRGAGWFILPNEQKVQGKPNFVAELRNNAEFMDKLWKDVYAAMPNPLYQYVEPKDD